MRSKVLLSVWLVVAFAAVAFAQQQPQWTGNAYRQLGPDSGIAYALGLVDGITLGAAIERTGGSVQDFYDACVRGRTRGQVKAIIDKYLADHPERWHEAMGGLVTRALVEACRR